MSDPPAALREALLDLDHDLGKYLGLPLALLPVGADADAVRGAARTALLRTRRSGGVATPARELWAAFRAEWDVDASPLGVSLRRAVETTLTWELRLDEVIDRAALERDLADVRRATRAWMDALSADDEG